MTSQKKLKMRDSLQSPGNPPSLIFPCRAKWMDLSTSDGTTPYSYAYATGGTSLGDPSVEGHAEIVYTDTIDGMSFNVFDVVYGWLDYIIEW